MTAFAAIPIRLASRCVVLLACATLVAAGEPTERKPSRRPNVVFLLADQWRAAGHRLRRRPERQDAAPGSAGRRGRAIRQRRVRLPGLLALSRHAL